MLDFDFLEKTFEYRNKITGIDFSCNDFEDIDVVFYDLIDCIFFLYCFCDYLPDTSKKYSVRVWLDNTEFKIYSASEFLRIFKGGQ